MSGGVVPFLEQLAPGAREANTVEAVLPARFASPGSQGVLEELELETPSGTRPPEGSAAPPRALLDTAQTVNGAALILGSEMRPPSPPSSPAVRPGAERPRWGTQEPSRAAPARHTADVASLTRTDMTLDADPAADRGLIGAITPARPHDPGPVHESTVEPAPAFVESRPPLREAVVAHRQSTARDRDPVLHVTIDHIDVRSAPPTATAAPATPKRRPSPTQSLADYLRGREGGTGGGRA